MRRTSLRSAEMHERYKNAPKDPDFLRTTPSLKDFEYWRIIPNEYLHDTIAETHHMLVPRREFAEEWDTEPEEAAELKLIKQYYLDTRYDSYCLNFSRNRTVPSWLHYHLYIYKEVLL